MAESLELNAPLATETAQRRGSATLLFDGLLRLVGCGPGRVAAYDLVRIALGVVLLTAAAFKGHQLATSPTAEVGILTSRWFLIGIVECELALGVWLISGLYGRAARYVSIATFTLFGAVSLFRALRGDTSCGCFGGMTVSPWLTALADSAAVFILVSLKPHAHPALLALSAPRAALGLLALLFIGSPVGAIMGLYRPGTLGAGGEVLGGSTVVLQPDSWVGKRLPILRHIDIGERLAKGQWTLLLVHRGCADCAMAIAYYERLAARAGSVEDGRRIAFIEVRSQGDAPHANTFRAPIEHGVLAPAHDWFVATPTVLTLFNATVLAAQSPPDVKSACRGGTAHKP